MSDISDLEDIRKTLIDLRILINDKRTPSGTRKRATRALGDTAIRACDTALAALKAAQQGHAETEMLP